MSLVIQPCAGFVHVFNQGPGSGTGMYSIKDLSVSGCLITSVGFGMSEIVQPSVSLDDKRTLYVFGSGWNEMTVSGVLLLGQSGRSDIGQPLDGLIKWYNTNRVSASKSFVNVSLAAAGGFEAYVVGMRTGAVDPQFNKQAFDINLLTPKTSRNQA